MSGSNLTNEQRECCFYGANSAERLQTEVLSVEYDLGADNWAYYDLGSREEACRSDIAFEEYLPDGDRCFDTDELEDEGEHDDGGPLHYALHGGAQFSGRSLSGDKHKKRDIPSNASATSCSWEQPAGKLQRRTTTTQVCEQRAPPVRIGRESPTRVWAKYFLNLTELDEYGTHPIPKNVSILLSSVLVGYINKAY